MFKFFLNLSPYPHLQSSTIFSTLTTSLPFDACAASAVASPGWASSPLPGKSSQLDNVPIKHQQSRKRSLPRGAHSQIGAQPPRSHGFSTTSGQAEPVSFCTSAGTGSKAEVPVEAASECRVDKWLQPAPCSMFTTLRARRPRSFGWTPQTPPSVKLSTRKNLHSRDVLSVFR
jgi:hypothetical protein